MADFSTLYSVLKGFSLCLTETVWNFHIPGRTTQFGLVEFCYILSEWYTLSISETESLTLYKVEKSDNLDDQLQLKINQIKLFSDFMDAYMYSYCISQLYLTPAILVLAQNMI